MADDTDIDDYFSDRAPKRPEMTLEGRYARENRPLARADRVRISNIEKKERQLNMKVKPSVYEEMSATARRERLSMPDLLEELLKKWNKAED